MSPCIWKNRTNHYTAHTRPGCAPEGVSMREPGPGLARSYLIEEDVYLSKDWQKTKLGEKHC